MFDAVLGGVIARRRRRRGNLALMPVMSLRDPVRGRGNLRQKSLAASFGDRRVTSFLAMTQTGRSAREFSCHKTGTFAGGCYPPLRADGNVILNISTFFGASTRRGRVSRPAVDVQCRSRRRHCETPKASWQSRLDAGHGFCGRFPRRLRLLGMTENGTVCAWFFCHGTGTFAGGYVIRYISTFFAISACRGRGRSADIFEPAERHAGFFIKS